jgi:hypothetical protein
MAIGGRGNFNKLMLPLGWYILVVHSQTTTGVSDLKGGCTREARYTDERNRVILLNCKASILSDQCAWLAPRCKNVSLLDKDSGLVGICLAEFIARAHFLRFSRQTERSLKKTAAR